MMKPLSLTLLTLALTAGFFGLRAQEESTALAPGLVGAQMIGRMLTSAGGGELVGYFPQIEGIPNILAGDPGEGNAYFTFRSTRFTLNALRNDPLLHFRTAPAPGVSAVLLRVYQHSSPKLNFDDPDTFSSGQVIAEYRARGGLTTVLPFTATFNTGSFSRQSASDFQFNGRTYNLGRMAPSITVELKGAPLDLALISRGGAAIPFGGIATVAAP